MSSLKDKLYNHEVTPPPGTWDKIAINIDEAEMANKFPARLYNMEVAPPANSWEKVNASLNPVVEPSVSLLKRIPAFFRYAAAAIFIGAIAFGIIKLTASSNNHENNTAQASINKDSSESVKNKPTLGEQTQRAKINTDEDDAALEQSKNLVAKLDRSAKTITRKFNTGRTHIPYIDDSDAELSQSIYAYEDHVPNMADRYVMLMTPDGNIIRMSKKWSDLLCCVSGEEQDPECKDQLKKWQQKMATSSLAPSPGNFLDILGMVNSLNENTEL
jgi:hypothetical protein